MQLRTEFEPLALGNRPFQPPNHSRPDILLGGKLHHVKRPQHPGVDRNGVASQGHLSDVGHGEVGGPVELCQVLHRRAEVPLAYLFQVEGIGRFEDALQHAFDTIGRSGRIG